MANPELVEFVEVFQGMVELGDGVRGRDWIEFSLEDPKQKMRDVRVNRRVWALVTSCAECALQARGEKPFDADLQRDAAGRARKQIRENAGQTQHPHFEIARREINPTALLDSTGRHSHQAVDRILGLVFRQKPIDKLDDMRGKHRPVIVGKQLHRRIQQVRRLDSHQIAILLLRKHDPGMCQRLQRRAEAVLHATRAVSDAADFSIFAAEKRDDTIRLAKWIRLQNDGIALMNRHETVIIPQ